MDSGLQRLSRYLGVSLRRGRITLDSRQPYNEIYSYALCRRFYGRRKELIRAINFSIFSLKKQLQSGGDRDLIYNLYAIIGNLYYILGEFKVAAGYFMVCLSLEKDDITPWAELLFCMRALGEYELFEKGIFNFEKIVKRWQDDPIQEMDQAKIYSLLSGLKSPNLDKSKFC